MTENQPARLPAAAAGDGQDIYLRDKDGGTDVMFDGGAAGPDGQPLTAQAAAEYARSLNAAGGGTYRAVAVVTLET